MRKRFAIVDARCNATIIEQLHNHVEDVFLFKSEGITYESISCHPDIFIYQEAGRLIIAPNTPQELYDWTNQKGIAYIQGECQIGTSLQDSCYYNCISTKNRLFHKEGFTDSTVLSLNQRKEFIQLPQSYTRCSMLPLTEESFITSDAGIHKILQEKGLTSFLFSPDEIRIAVHRNGFLGGTCGITDEKIFFLGNPLLHKDGERLCQFIEETGLKIIPLCNEKLYDGGGIFFL